MIHITCDGCSECEGGEMAERGFVTKAHYCPRAQAIHDAYLQARDDLHDEVARHWTEGLAALDAEYGTKLKVLADA